MEERESKLDQVLKLSHEILDDLENQATSFEKILLKCQRLARLRDDFEAVGWFSLELHGYDWKRLPPGVDEAMAASYAARSGRAVLEKDQETGQEQWFYIYRSVPELEAMIQTDSRFQLGTVQ